MRDNRRRRVLQVIISSVITLAIVGVLFYASAGRDIPVLDPSGLIANQQFTLIAITVGLGLFIIIPVFILLFVIAWKYRDTNKKAVYDPNLKDSRLLEAIWWGVPCIIVIILAGITWISTHALDPYKPIESDVTPVKVQVVSLEWKWLFIYPELNIATLNYLNIPKETPIELSVTSDAPMNSLWIPALAGQVYTMTGMETKLHIMSDKVGTYKGASANISGAGYADMMFNVYSMDEHDFQEWATKASQSQHMLTSETYAALLKPSSGDKEKTYMLMEPYLFHTIMMKYMEKDGGKYKGIESAENDSSESPASESDAHSHHQQTTTTNNNNHQGHEGMSH